jgi:hypothetical protein
MRDVILHVGHEQASCVPASALQAARWARCSTCAGPPMPDKSSAATFTCLAKALLPPAHALSLAGAGGSRSNTPPRPGPSAPQPARPAICQPPCAPQATARRQSNFRGPNLPAPNSGRTSQHQTLHIARPSCAKPPCIKTPPIAKPAVAPNLPLAGWDRFLLPPPAALSESLLEPRPDNRALAPQPQPLLVDREAVGAMLAEVRRVVASDRFHETLVVSRSLAGGSLACLAPAVLCW